MILPELLDGGAKKRKLEDKEGENPPKKQKLEKEPKKTPRGGNWLDNMGFIYKKLWETLGYEGEVNEKNIEELKKACFTKERAWKLIEETFEGLKEGMSEGLWGQISIYDDTRRIYKLKVKKDEYLWLMCAKQGKEKKKQVQKRLSSMIFADKK